MTRSQHIAMTTAAHPQLPTRRAIRVMLATGVGATLLLAAGHHARADDPATPATEPAATYAEVQPVAHHAESARPVSAEAPRQVDDRTLNAIARWRSKQPTPQRVYEPPVTNEAGPAGGISGGGGVASMVRSELTGQRDALRTAQPAFDSSASFPASEPAFPASLPPAPPSDLPPAQDPGVLPPMSDMPLPSAQDPAAMPGQPAVNPADIPLASELPPR